MKKIMSFIISLSLVMNIVSIGNNSNAATMMYYDNIDVSEFPKELQEHLNVHPWEDGFIDISKAPYEAKGDGIHDDSDAIQKAVNDAYASNLIVYFPQGNYLVTKQIELIQWPANIYQKDKGIKFHGQRKFGNLLIGSTKGNKRPKIILKDNSNIKNNELLLFKYYDPRESDLSGSRAKHYLATIRGIDIDMGINPNSSAISMDGAQYCTIQNVKITGKSFYAGINKIPGAVGSIINLEVDGGKIGILSDSYVPEALIVGTKLINQEKYGIKIVDSRNSPVNLVGVEIKSSLKPSSDYRGVYMNEMEANDFRKNQSGAHITIADSSIEVMGGNGIAIENYNQYVVMKNTYIKADTIIKSGIKNPPIETLNGNKDTWFKIGDYAFVSKDNNGYININNIEYGNNNENNQYYSNIVIQDPDVGLIEKHIWTRKMPSYDEDKINIVTEYGVTPYNHFDDDSIGIQKAIDDTTELGNPNYGKAVFIPRGHFHIKNPIYLKRNLILFGAGKNISVIHADEEFSIVGDTSILETQNNKSENIILSDFAILRQQGSKSKNLENHKSVSMLKLKGDNVIVRDVQFAGIEGQQDNYYLNSEVVLSENCGGKIYNLAVNTGVKASKGGNIHGDYRRVLIDGTSNNLNIYQCGVNNTEKAALIEISNSKNVSIFGIKYEEQNRLMEINKSSNISVIGGYGYFTIVDNVDAIIDIKQSENIYIAGLGRNSMKKYKERRNKYWIKNDVSEIKDDEDVILYKFNEPILLSNNKELITNGDFENELYDWNFDKSENIKLETEYVYSGKKSIEIENIALEKRIFLRDITSILKDNGRGNYFTSSWIMNKYKKQTSKKNKESSHVASIVIEIKDKNGTKRYKIKEQSHNYWNRISGKLDLDWIGNIESAKLYIENSYSSGFYYLDKMSLIKLES